MDEKTLRNKLQSELMKNGYDVSYSDDNKFQLNIEGQVFIITIQNFWNENMLDRRKTKRVVVNE